MQETTKAATAAPASTAAVIVGATSNVACGTAAVITPIGIVRDADGEFTVGDGKAGEVTMALREQLVSIQRGTAPDPYGWVHRVL